MAYIDRQTYNIWANSTIEGVIENCFEVDDDIALIIQALNRKGYTTEYCCSGHPCKTLTEITVKGHFNEKGTQVILDDNDDYITAPIASTFMPLYIAFAESVTIPKTDELPEGFFTEADNVIRYIYKSDEFFPFLHERVEVMEALFKWVQALPNRQAE